MAQQTDLERLMNRPLIVAAVLVVITIVIALAPAKVFDLLAMGGSYTPRDALLQLSE